MPLKAPARAFHFTIGAASISAAMSGTAAAAQVDLGEPDPTSFRKSLGRPHRRRPGWLQPCAAFASAAVGVEADLFCLRTLCRRTSLRGFAPRPTPTYAEKIEMMETLRGRVGYAFDHWMIYATGGFARSLWTLYSNVPGVVDETDRVLHLHTGWAAGAGTEVALAPSWTLRLEYLYRNLGQADVVFLLGRDGRLVVRHPHRPRGT